jgi:DNA invertase Pin-like site-specific DNA recombinase
MAVNTGKFVCYYRVSTARQGKSGLGLEAQRDQVRNYLNGGDWTVAGEFTEVESGKRNDRPELAKAFAACRLHRATLVIAKLDRLARNAAFLIGLRDSGIDFVAADMPNANKLTVGIMALVAEDEAERISARTKAALARSKKKLGGFRGYAPSNKDRAAARQALRARSAARAAELKPEIEKLQASGVTSLTGIAAGLNAAGIPTARGNGEWSAVQVSRVLATLGG